MVVGNLDVDVPAVEMTTLVHLSRQLSNLRHELRSLFDAL